jgi:hypothetical protein
MPSFIYLSLIPADDIRRRRMCEAAEYREGRKARRANARSRAGRPRGEPAGCPAPPRRSSRWLALP